MTLEWDGPVRVASKIPHIRNGRDFDVALRIFWMDLWVEQLNAPSHFDRAFQEMPRLTYREDLQRRERRFAEERMRLHLYLTGRSWEDYRWRRPTT